MFDFISQKHDKRKQTYDLRNKNCAPRKGFAVLTSPKRARARFPGNEQKSPQGDRAAGFFYTG
jgi:hypothetical protein